MVTELAAAILLVSTVWVTPEGVAVYTEPLRSAPGGPHARAEHLAELFIEAGETYELDPYLVAALAFRESGFDPHAVGAIGERSIMQLHPRSRWGHAARLLCRGQPRLCERMAVLEGARVLALGLRQCGTEARALGFYRTGRCAVGPGARRVLRTRRRMQRKAAPRGVDLAACGPAAETFPAPAMCTEGRRG